jgi:UDP-3-O-[3-hydroxymyristoyl] glucosamine N-acyltransferase
MISALAVIELDTDIRSDAVIDEFVIVRRGARIGRGTHLHAGVVVEEGAWIGDGVTVFPHAYIGKQPKVAGVIARKPHVHNAQTRIGDGSVIGTGAVIYAGAQIGASVLIGDGVTVREDTEIGEETVVGSNSTIQNGARIGKRVKIVDLSHITFDCEIGDEAFISVGVYTMNDNSMQRGGEVVGPKIGARARIGGGALLLPGVRIGEDAVVGAGSVVSKDVVPGSKVMGVPARTHEQRQYREHAFGGYGDQELMEQFFGGSPRRPLEE